jgi:hypothetical protein
MVAGEDEKDGGREAVVGRGCLRPIRTSSGVWVRCGSRLVSKCPSCAELYRGDWAAIARSGIFDGPVENFRFYLLTLTAPSFGRVHRVPRSMGKRAKRCGCGAQHGVCDTALRGVPLDPARYDYAGQVAWNRDAGLLWDRTRRRLRDRWDSAEFFLVREWQDRGVLHLHVLVRISRTESPGPKLLGQAARTATAASKIGGSVVEWGDQVDAAVFRADGNGARTIWYLSKALNYVMKDATRAALGERGGPEAWFHLVELQRAARVLRCSPNCVPSECGGRVHDRYGSRSHVVSASRRTRHRTGWSFTGLTRTVQRRLRLEWILARDAGSSERTSRTPGESQDAAVALAEARHRAAVACAAALP